MTKLWGGLLSLVDAPPIDLAQSGIKQQPSSRSKRPPGCRWRQDRLEKKSISVAASESQRSSKQVIG